MLKKIKENSNSPVLILSHSDLDGSVAAFCIARLLEFQGLQGIPRFVPVSLALPLARDILMLEKSAPPLVIADISASIFGEVLGSLLRFKLPGFPLLFDHHQESLVYAEEEWCVASSEHCAASAVFEWGKDVLCHIHGLEELVHYTTCQDLWKKPLPRKSQELNALCCLYGPEGFYHLLWERGVSSLLYEKHIGEAIVCGRSRRLAGVFEHTRKAFWRGHSVLLGDFPENVHIVFSDANFVADQALDEADLYIRVLQHQPLKLSARSRNGEALEFVRFLADQEKQKGREASGGGHPNAAGLAMTESSWKDVSEQVLIPAE